MSASNERRWPRALRGALGYILALLLALALTGACGLTLARRLLTDQELYERVAADDRVLDAQAARVEETVRRLADQYAFAPEAALNVVTRDSLADYAREAAGWWLGLLGEYPEMEAPFPDTAAIEEAVREDALFRESTEDFMRRSIARDEVAYPIGEAMQRAVLPLRVSLLSLAMPKVAERVDLPALIGLTGTVQRALLAACAALLALILLTQGKSRWLFASAGVMAAGCLTVAVTLIALMADLPGAFAEYSAILAIQFRVLQRALLPSVLGAEGALLLAALLMMALARGKRDAVGHERKSA